MLFIMPAGVWPGRKSKELKPWGPSGLWQPAGQRPLERGGAVVASQRYLLVAVGTLGPRVSRRDPPAGARKWLF